MKPLHELDSNTDDDDRKYFIRIPGMESFWGTISRMPDEENPLWCFWNESEETCVWTNQPVTILDGKIYACPDPNEKQR